MFGLGWQELVVILVIVLIIFGPTQLPKLAKMLGESVRSLKKAANGESDDTGPKTPDGGNGKT